ncbi:MAG: integrase [Flavobacterium sp.]|jgi:integrase
MPSILKTLHQINDLVYGSVYGFEFNFFYIAEYLDQFSKIKTMLKPDFSVPKIYSGGIKVTEWENFSKELQKEALKKDWYIYYSFRCPDTGLLKRQTPIKGNVNTLKTKRERLAYLNVMRNNLEKLLNNGSSPYIKNDFSYLDCLFNKTTQKEPIKPIQSIEIESKIEKEHIENTISIKEAFELTLKLKKNVMNETSFGNYQLRIKKFMNFLPDIKEPITSITKKDVINFLNSVLESTSPRNRNNYRTDLNSFFNELENNEFILSNFIAKINILKSNPERNKTFSDAKQLDIYKFLEKNDTLLLLFIKFISYNLLRPVEVCRLKIKDIDVNENKLYVRAKNKAVKIKIVPDILLNDLPDLSKMNPEHYLFTPNGLGMEWDIKENNKRDFFSKRFNEVVKKEFGLNKDFGLYSFRHTFITRLYRKLRETNSQQIAKSELMLITGHTTITALDKYLRDIDAELPEDYSYLLK